MSRRTLLLTLASLLVTLVSAARAEACTCMVPGPPCQAFGAASAVFVGTVTAVRTREAKSVEAARAEIDWSPVVVKFSVLQPFHGVEGAEVEVSTGRGGGDCGYQFRRGESYLVYAHGGRDGKTLTASTCSRTQPISQAAEDLEFLRALGARGSGVSIDITVERGRQDVKSGEVKSLGGLADARLTIEGAAGESREVRTDSEGRARLTGLKPGTYKIKLALPEGLMTHREEQEVTIADRGCASVHYAVADDGRISGRVTDAEGRAVAGVLVALVGADDDPERPNPRYEWTAEDGRYEHKSLPPGRYLLAVNYNRYPEPNDPSNAYPRTYYPGAAEPSQAEAVSVGAGERVKDRDISLPARRGESVVTGVVVWDDGSPVANARISFRDVTYHDPGVDNGAPNADERGRFTLKGYRGQTFLLTAGSNRQFVGDSRDGPMERVEALRVTLDEPTERVRIVITKLR
ncbi:MAG: carboxypeptidase regulatory-like domain-containing protein [Pyrinomonadaceae bacterium]